jgi:hypothetical protein
MITFDESAEITLFSFLPVVVRSNSQENNRGKVYRLPWAQHVVRVNVLTTIESNNRLRHGNFQANDVRTRRTKEERACVREKHQQNLGICHADGSWTEGRKTAGAMNRLAKWITNPMCFLAPDLTI